MPKKTRKQKMQADRRHNNPLPLSVENTPPTPVQAQSTFQFQAAKSSEVQMRQTEVSIELLAIRHDIIKTVILAIIAFGIEVALYWRWYR